MAIESIEVSGYKIIQEPLRLDNLAKVNYLVGPNGSGKSSILGSLFNNSLKIEQLKLLQLSATSRFYNEYNESSFYGKVKVISNSGEKMILNKGNNLLTNKILKIYSSNNDDFYRHNLELGFFRSVFNNQFFTKENIDNHDPRLMENAFYNLFSKDVNYSKYIHDLEIIDNKNWSLFTSIYHLGLQDIDYKNISEETLNKVIAEFGGINNIVKELGLTIYASQEKYIEYGHSFNLSSGQYTLLHLYQIHTLLNRFHKQNQQKEIIIFEEPESYLHPKFQKVIPYILSNLSEFFNVQIFVSTHSPFIISESGKHKNQRVYLIEDGKCLNPSGNGEPRGIVAKMLGAGIDDLTPSKVLFCAQSEKELLERINNAWYFQDMHFVVPIYQKIENGGDEALLKLQAYIESGNYKDTFYLGSELWFYLDSPNKDQMKNNDKQKYNSTEQVAYKLTENRVIYSGKTKFELKFTDNETLALTWHKKPIDFARGKAIELIENGETGKKEFEKLFPELAPLFGFDKSKEIGKLS